MDRGTARRASAERAKPGVAKDHRADARQRPPVPPGASPPSTATDALVQDLRAQLVSMTEANRLLIAAQQDLLDAGQSSQDATDTYRAAARRYLDALGQFMTPGHLGDLADL